MADNDGKVQVRITDQAGGKNVNARLPANAPVAQLLQALIAKLEMPANQTYHLIHKDSGKQLTDTDTLASAGVLDGHTIRLVPNVTAG